jgi:hypothetical protein
MVLLVIITKSMSYKNAKENILEMISNNHTMILIFQKEIIFVTITQKFIFKVQDLVKF